MPLIERVFLEVVGMGKSLKLGVADDLDLLGPRMPLAELLVGERPCGEAVLRGEELSALLAGNEQGKQHGEKAFPCPLHAGPDEGDGIRDKAQKGLFAVLEPPLFGLESLH